MRLAGRAAIQRPLREALVQRGFETWIHAEDVRAVLAAPPRPPSARQMADIVEFAAAAAARPRWPPPAGPTRTARSGWC